MPHKNPKTSSASEEQGPKSAKKGPQSEVAVCSVQKVANPPTCASRAVMCRASIPATGGLSGPAATDGSQTCLPASSVREVMVSPTCASRALTCAPTATTCTSDEKSAICGVERAPATGGPKGAAICGTKCDPVQGCTTEESSGEQLSKFSGSVAKKLTSCLAFWMTFCTSLFILDIIRVGYKIPFISVPPKAIFSNNKSALTETDFVEAEISRLLSKGYIKWVSQPPHVVNPLTVSINDKGKRRLILDARHVNLHLFKFVVKYEGLEVFQNYLEKGGFMVKFDLESGYHHIKIFPEHQTYLGFSWGKGAKKRFYQFTVLPFGLSSACSVFTKFMKPLVKRWRERGCKVVLYLDDGIVYNKCFETLETQAEFIRQDMESCGISLNAKKCSWYPSHCLTWLGIIIDLKNASFVAPPEKVLKIQRFLGAALGSTSTTARLVSRLVGCIVALKISLGPRAIFYTRYMQMFVRDAISWDGLVLQTEAIRTEMSYWKKFFDEHVAKWPIEDLPLPTSSLALYTDASNTGYGGYIREIVGSDYSAIWFENENLRSSTLKELKACFFVMIKMVAYVRYNNVFWYTDNRNCVKIVKFGSMVPELHNLALELNEFLERNQISLIPRWIPRVENFYADELSKGSTDRLKINIRIYEYFNTIWGPFTSDWFESVPEEVLYRKRVNAENFSPEWREHNNWLVPPPNLAGKVLQHMRRCLAEGVLVVPKWQSAPFWPLLSDGNGFLPCVKDHVEYITPTNFFERSSVIFSGKLKFNMIVLKIVF